MMCCARSGRAPRPRNSLSSRKLTVVGGGGFGVCFARLLRAIKMAERVNLSVSRDARLEFLSHLAKSHALEAASIILVLNLVLLVLSVGCLSKVLNSIVCLDHVYVVNVVFGPFSITVEPSQPVRRVMNSTNANNRVPVARQGSSDLTYFNSV